MLAHVALIVATTTTTAASVASVASTSMTGCLPAIVVIAVAPSVVALTVPTTLPLIPAGMLPVAHEAIIVKLVCPAPASPSR